jgi:peptidoglycan/xylan/chitin deacetylase (PgdA/CDA1 family)
MSASVHINSAVKSFAAFVARSFGSHRFSARSPRLWILMYHRVLPPPLARKDRIEPGMYVTPETFENHIRWLGKFFEVVALGDWVRRRQAGMSLPQRACAITFDDGWSDNFDFAFPILRRSQTPATIFLIADSIGRPYRLWTTRLIDLLIHVDAEHRRHPSYDWLRQFVDLRIDGTFSQEDVSLLLSRCKSLGDTQIMRFLDLMEAATPPNLSAERRHFLTWEQICKMRESGLIDFGSHTCGHVRLTADVQPDAAAHEIAGSKAMLERRLNAPVSLFCYPNGDCCDKTVKIVAENYDAAVTTRRGINSFSQPLETLMRIGLHEDVSNTESQFQAKLAAWF